MQWRVTALRALPALRLYGPGLRGAAAVSTTTADVSRLPATLLRLAALLAAAPLLLLARTPTSLLVYGGVVGVGIGLFITSNWALLTKLAPVAQAGVYLGLTNLATAGSGALGRLGGPLIDLLNNAHPGAYTGYTAMFLFGTACSILSALLLTRVDGRIVH